MNYLKNREPVVVALSGGTDSTVLLACAKFDGVQVAAVTVDTGLNPAGELEDAENIAAELSVPFHVIREDMLDYPEIEKNAQNRCYICKRHMMEAVIRWAEKSRYKMVADGTNADDDPEDRPGIAALEELGITSPFRECGIGKAEIATLARELGVEGTPSSSCMATRFPENTPVTKENVNRVREAEALLRNAGVAGRLRVRFLKGSVRIEAEPSQYQKILPVIDQIKDIGFLDVQVISPHRSGEG
jgi:uncharacterized protein